MSAKRVVTTTINGEKVEFLCEPRQTLLHVGGNFQLSDDRRTLAVRKPGEVQIYRVTID